MHGLSSEGTTVPSEGTIDGRARVSGGPLLKETQAYPKGYGVAVHNSWSQWRNSRMDNEDVDDDDLSSISDTGYQEIPDASRADLAEACQSLGLSSTRWMC